MKKMNNKNNNSGFTLLELIIGLAITLVIVVAVFSFILVGARSYDNTNQTTTVQQEVSFINNIIGSNVRGGRQEDTTILKDTNGIALYTGDKVFYYDKKGKSLYIYKGITLADSTKYKSNNEDNLISKNITSFDVSFEKTADDGNPLPSYTAGEVKGYSSLLRFTMTVIVRNKSDTSQILYDIRNNS